MKRQLHSNRIYLVDRRLGLDQVELIWMAIWGKKFGFLLAFVGAKWPLHNLPTMMIFEGKGNDFGFRSFLKWIYLSERLRWARTKPKNY
jgi:hypothetical protein